MELLKLILRNTLRHRLRSTLTIIGMAVAILAFCLLRTVVEAWYLGVAAASPDRLVTRNAVSLIFPLPIAYRQRILQTAGVSKVGYGNWFGGVYVDERQFFPRMAVGPDYFFNVYPEFILPREQLNAFWRQRNAAIAGRKIVAKYGWRLGDTIPMTGNIYPGEWQFVLTGIYRGASKTTDETQFFFRWDYLNEKVKQTSPLRADRVGWYVVQIDHPPQAAEVSRSIDALFKNSPAETLTETEKAFQMGFVAMTEAIVIAVRVVSFVVIGVILLVLANTMAMTARERMAEYAVLKTLGFGKGFLSVMITGESVTIAVFGGFLGILLAFPVAAVFAAKLGTLLPVFQITWRTMLLGLAASAAIGLLAALLPSWRAAHVRIVEALRHIG
jgi:putative ABC transport system permease protein